MGTRHSVLLIPIGGVSKRFKDQGINLPKPLIEVGGKRIIDWSLDSISKVDKTIFIVREDDCVNYNLDKKLLKLSNKATICKLYENTGGAVETCLKAKDLIDPESSLAIFTLDVWFKPRFDFADMPEEWDGGILTFSSSNPNYSFSETDPTGKIVRVAEKEVISNNASAGIYYFKTAKLFFDSAEKYNIEGEKHIAPIYNVLIEQGHNIQIHPVDKIYIMGTPQEKIFIEGILPTQTNTIGVVSDHSGYDAKQKMMKIITTHGMTPKDFGCYDDRLCDYSDYVPSACEALKNKEVKYVFGFCRTGQGVNIHANKIEGIRAALVKDEYTAEYAKRHNAANFFSVPEEASSHSNLENILEEILYNTFDGGRHQDRLMKINDF